MDLRALSPDSARKLNILGHNSDALGVDSAEIGVLEETDEVRLGRLLECEDGGSLESEVGLEVLSDLTHKSLERELADEELSGLLVSPDLTESHGTGAVSVGLLHASSSGSGLSSSLGGELFSGGLASSRFAGSLFRTSHFAIVCL
jgi:hypothetical protein